jgi:hypothetical protein
VATRIFNWAPTSAQIAPFAMAGRLDYLPYTYVE